MPEGIGQLLIAAALLLLVLRLLNTAVDRVLGWILIGGYTLVGAATLISGWTGAVQPVNSSVQWFYLVGLVVGLVLAVRIARDEPLDLVRKLWIAVLVVLALTMTLVEFIFFSVLYVSYDTPPWQGGLRAVLLAVLGLAVAAATVIRQAPAQD